MKVDHVGLWLVATQQLHGTTIGQNYEYGPRNELLQAASILMINAGRGGRCCHLAHSFCNRSEGLVPDLFSDFCATGQE